MKRYIAVLLSLAMLFALAACNGKEDTAGTSSGAADASSQAAHTVDVLSYAVEGVIPGVDVALGTYIGTVKEMYDYTPPEAQIEPASDEGDEGHDHGFDMVIYDSYTQVKVDLGDTYLFYKTKYEGSGISRIVCFKDAFDFQIGITMPEDIKAAVSAAPTREETVDAVDFLPSTPTDFSVVSYTTNDHTVDFYFTDDFLTCTVLTDNRYWTES